jgi:hypothetical protein
VEEHVRRRAEIDDDMGVGPTEENIENRLYDNSAVTYMRKGEGVVFAAGCTDLKAAICSSNASPKT